MGKPQQKKVKLTSPKEKTFVLSLEAEDNAKLKKFTEVDDNTKAELETSSQTNKSTDNMSFNWANITEKDLQDSEIWEDILVEQAKTRETSTEETSETEAQQNN